MTLKIEGIYITFERPALLKMLRQTHPKEAVRFLKEVKQVDKENNAYLYSFFAQPVDKSLMPLFAGRKIHVSYENGKLCVLLSNHNNEKMFSCDFVEPSDAKDLISLQWFAQTVKKCLTDENKAISIKLLKKEKNEIRNGFDFEEIEDEMSSLADEVAKQASASLKLPIELDLGSNSINSDKIEMEVDVSLRFKNLSVNQTPVRDMSLKTLSLSIGRNNPFSLFYRGDLSKLDNPLQRMFDLKLPAPKKVVNFVKEAFMNKGFDVII